jgi:2-keto-3-deoxy-L-rhamnonate aldolase RhmA
MNSLTKSRRKKINFIRKKLKSKIPSFGCWQQIQSIEISKILSNGSYDWVTLDLETFELSTPLFSCWFIYIFFIVF